MTDMLRLTFALTEGSWKVHSTLHTLQNWQMDKNSVLVYSCFADAVTCFISHCSQCPKLSLSVV